MDRAPTGHIYCHANSEVHCNTHPPAEGYANTDANSRACTDGSAHGHRRLTLAHLSEEAGVNSSGEA